MNTEHDSTTDTTRFSAGNPDTMDDDTLQPESSKKECANTEHPDQTARKCWSARHAEHGKQEEDAHRDLHYER